MTQAKVETPTYPSTLIRMTFTVAQWVVRITGILALILGLLIWTESGLRSLVPIHMLIGVVLVLGLWLLAATAWQIGVPPGLAVGAAILGLIALVLGLTQTSLLQDSTHWIVQVLHLIVGMAAVGIGEMIGGRVRRQKLAASTGS